MTARPTRRPTVPDPRSGYRGVLCAVTIALLVLQARSAEATGGAEVHRIERRVGAMGTWLTLEVEHETRAAALAASELAWRAIETVEARLSTWRDDSELAGLNAAPWGEAFELSAALRADLVRARELWEATGGAFDPAVGRLVQLWGLRVGGERPSAAQIEAALRVGGFGALELSHGSAIRRHAELVLEEGGFGKGVGLDAACAALRAAGVLSAALDLGGQVAVVASAEQRTYGIAHPAERERAVVELTIERGSFATSGNAERGVTIDGKLHGHILDPRTGLPAPNFGSLTVWAADATTADALSTALFVMGPEAALAWAAERHDVEVIAIESGAATLRIRATAGLRQRLVPVEGHTIEFTCGAEGSPSNPRGEQEVSPRPVATRGRTDRIE